MTDKQCIRCTYRVHLSSRPHTTSSTRPATVMPRCGSQCTLGSASMWCAPDELLRVMLCSCFQKATLPVDVPADRMPAAADQDKLLMVADTSDRMSSSTEQYRLCSAAAKTLLSLHACLLMNWCVWIWDTETCLLVYMSSTHNKATCLTVARQRVQTPRMHLQTQQASKQELQAGILQSCCLQVRT